MAYIKAKDTLNSAAQASIDIEIPSPHEAGDVILLNITQDMGGTAITTAATGWNLVSGSQSAVGAQRTVNYWKVATSDNEADVTFDGHNDEWAVTITVWANADTTNFINEYSVTSSAANVSTITSTALTTTEDNCTIFHVSGFDREFKQYVDNGALVNVSKVAVSQCSNFTGYYNQDTKGVTYPVEFVLATPEGGQVWALAIQDADPSNPQMAPYSTEGLKVVSYLGSYRVTHGTGLQLPSTLTATTVSGYGIVDNLDLNATQNTDSPYGVFTRFRSDVITSPDIKYFGFVVDVVEDFTDHFLFFEYEQQNTTQRVPSLYTVLILEDSAGNWKSWEITNSRGYITQRAFDVILDIENTPAFESSGDLDLSDVTKIAMLCPSLTTSVTVRSAFATKGFYKIRRATLVGGSTESPVSVLSLKPVVDGWTDTRLISVQGNGQVLTKVPFKIGEAGKLTSSSTFGQSCELPLSFNERVLNRRFWRVEEESIVNSVFAGSSGNVGLNSSIFATATKQKFLIDPASSTAAEWDFSGTSFIGYQVVNNVLGVDFNSATFSTCYRITLNGGGLDACTVASSLDEVAVITNNPENIKETEFISGGTGHAIEMTAAGTFDFLKNNFVGYGASDTSDAAIYNNSGGLITLVLAEGDAIPTILNGVGASTVIEAFVESVGVAFTNLIAGSQVVVYDAGTTDEYFRTESSGTTAGYNEVTTSLDLDYTIQKAGYVPIRVTGLMLTSVQTIPVQQVEDRAYQVSEDLTFDTNAFANPATKIFDLTVASTVQNFYSFMIEAWIAESSLNNVQFPLEPNGGNSFTFGAGWEWADQDAIDLLSRDGMRYRNAGVVTAVWMSILSIGDATGLLGRYQQVLGAAGTDAPSTGAFDQLIQVFGDATHGDFDYSDYLVLKYQANGFFQSLSDVVAIYGELADEAYVTALQPVAIPDFTTGDPAITGVTITNHGASPVSWDAGNGAKDYSITIADSGTNSGENILRWVNYNLSLGGTFQGDEAFNWFDMITTDGVTIETFRGNVIGSAGAALKGVRVIRTGDVAHPDFTRFQADDGTYGLAPEVQSVTVTNGVAGTRLQIYDLTSSTELYNDVPGSYPHVWQDTAAYVADREIRVRAMYQSGVTAKLFIDSVIGIATESAPALSVRLNQDDDDVYITNAINGSAVTDIVIDDGDLLVEIDTGTVSWLQLYAYETYWLFTEEGIRDEGRFIEAKDTANYILYDFKIKNITSPEVPLTITNGWGYDSVTGTTIELFDTTGGAIFAAPDRVVAFATGSGLSSEQAAQLALVPQIKPNTDLIPALL